MGGSGVGLLPSDLELATSLGAGFVEVYYEDAVNPVNWPAIQMMQG